MPETNKSSVITQYIVDLLEANKEDLGLRAVYYGAQELIPEFPAAEVESYPKDRLMDGPNATTRKFELRLRTGIMLHWGRLDQTAEMNKKEAEEATEAVEALLHQDKRFGGLVHWGFIRRIDPGIVQRSEVKLRSARMIWEGLAREGY